MKGLYRFLSLLLALALLAGLLGGCISEETLDAANTLLELLDETEGSASTPTPEPTQAPEPSEAPAPADTPSPTETPAPEPSEAPLPDEDGVYTSKEDVLQYLIAYGRLPQNFITKAEAKAAGWPGGSLEPYCPGKCIGGDRFGNYEGLLPKAKGRTWTECDINTLGASSRGAERILFSNDGLIFYTGDHYGSFEQLYP